MLRTYRPCLRTRLKARWLPVSTVSPRAGLPWEAESSALDCIVRDHLALWFKLDGNSAEADCRIFGSDVLRYAPSAGQSPHSMADDA